MQAARRVLHLVVIVLALPLLVPAQIPMISVRGTVVDPSNKPLAGAIVRAMNLIRSDAVMAAITDNSGQFYYRVPPGRYRLSATVQDENRMLSGSIDVIVYLANTDTRWLLKLKPVSQPQSDNPKNRIPEKGEKEKTTKSKAK